MKLRSTTTTLANFKIAPGRCVGNSTKQLKLAIKLLKAGEAVKVKDHWEHGNNVAANVYLMHRLIKLLEKQELKFIIDSDNLIIKLKQ